MPRFSTLIPIFDVLIGIFPVGLFLVALAPASSDLESDVGIIIFLVLVAYQIAIRSFDRRMSWGLLLTYVAVVFLTSVLLPALQPARESATPEQVLISSTAATRSLLRTIHIGPQPLGRAEIDMGDLAR